VNLSAYKDFEDHTNAEDIDDEIETLEVRSVQNLVSKALEGDVQGSDKLLLRLYSSGGFTASYILNNSFEIISNDAKISKSLKYDLLARIGEYVSRLNRGSDELLQMRCFLVSLGRCKFIATK
jgi:DNA polymerase III delta prime subunit